MDAQSSGITVNSLGTNPNDISGWLASAGDTQLHWDLRWYLLREGLLFCFLSDYPLSPCIGILSIHGFLFRSADELKTKKGIKAYHPDGRTHYFVLGCPEDAAQWLRTFSRNSRASSPPTQPISIPLQNDDVIELNLLEYFIEDPSSSSQITKSSLDRLLSQPTEYPKAIIKQKATELALKCSTDYFLVKARYGFKPPTSGSFISTLMRKKKGKGSTSNPSSPRGSTDSVFKTQEDLSLPKEKKEDESGSESESEHSISSESVESLTVNKLSENSPLSQVHTSQSIEDGLSVVEEAKLVDKSNEESIKEEEEEKEKEKEKAVEEEEEVKVIRREKKGGEDILSPLGMKTMSRRRQSLAALDSEKRGKHIRESSIIERLNSVNDAFYELAPSFKEGFLKKTERRIDGGEPQTQNETQDENKNENEEQSLWFLLDDYFFRAYANDDSADCILEIDLRNFEWKAEGEDSISLTPKENPETITILNAGNSEEQTDWINHLQEMRNYFLLTESDQIGFEGTETPMVDEKDVQEFNDEIERMVSTMQSTHDEEAPLSPVYEKVEVVQLKDQPESQSSLEQGTKPDLKSSKSAELLATKAKMLKEAEERNESILFPIQEKKKAKMLDSEKMKEYSVKSKIEGEGGEGDTEQGEKPQEDEVMMGEEEDVVVQFQVDQNGVIDEYQMTGGTLDVFINRLAGEQHPDSKYVDTMLLCYRHLMSAEAFLKRLIRRFNIVPPPNPTSEQQSYYDRWNGIIKVRTVSVLKKWIDNYWVDFAYDDAAESLLDEFVEAAPKANPDFAQLFTRIQNIMTQKKDEMKLKQLTNIVLTTSLMSVSTPPPNSPLSLSSSGKSPIRLDFYAIDPREFATQMTLLEHEKFKSIEPVEFVIRLWEGNGPLCKNVTDMIDLFNRISYFVATTVRILFLFRFLLFLILIFIFILIYFIFILLFLLIPYFSILAIILSLINSQK